VHKTNNFHQVNIKRVESQITLKGFGGIKRKPKQDSQNQQRTHMSEREHIRGIHIFTTTLLTQLYVRAGILLTRGKHLNDSIM